MCRIEFPCLSRFNVCRKMLKEEVLTEDIQDSRLNLLGFGSSIKGGALAQTSGGGWAPGKNGFLSTLRL
jgi:hypothetical protein